MKNHALNNMNPVIYNMLHEMWYTLKSNTPLGTYYPDFRDFIYANRNIDLITLQFLCSELRIF